MQTGPPDPYLPRPAVIEKIVTENPQIKTFILSFRDQAFHDSFTYEPGQFLMVSAPHCGEAPISLSSSPTRPGKIHLSVRRAGKLTGALFTLAKGAIVGLRGPYGRPFPMSALEGHDLLFVAGGIGLAPLRAVITFCLDRRDRYGRISLLYGSRTPADMAFREDIALWRSQPEVECLLTVDAPEPGWKEHVGLVPSLLEKIAVAPRQGKALVCGPPLMIRHTLPALSRLGFDDNDIITTLERHMKCGVGLCRHCHLDDKLVCVDGPVFTRAELKTLDVMELKA